MSESNGRAVDVPPALGRRIDEVCDRFEAAWQAGERPRLEDFAAGWTGDERAALLRELEPLDADYRACPAEVGGNSPAAAAGTPRALVADRYQLMGWLGEGAEGIVTRRHDATLDREVAYKILHEEHQDRPEQVRRFEEEARIHARLQHPGIVPVYETGRAEDTRPFFTMKVVEGSTLADLLDERASPADGLTRFLVVFEQICQAVGYAHSQGVIHRDLKPRNVMVGAFGEVQVMDWGFAKELVRQPQGHAEGDTLTDSSPTSPTPSPTADSQGETRPIGTPQYMPPEQAREESQRADERADVFGLGAILCVILTGQPPFVGGSREEVMAKAKAGDVADAFARLDRCGADAELVALCKECLAPRAEGRPANGGEVAARVAGYQAAVRERLRNAELERAIGVCAAVCEVFPHLLGSLSRIADRPCSLDENLTAVSDFLDFLDRLVGLGRKDPAGPLPGPH